MANEPTVKVTRRKLADYKPAPDNPNQHNERGLQAIEDSINYNGAGRSGLAANDGTLLAGNGTWEAMQRAGVEEVIEVEANGKQWVVVRRQDLAPTDARAKSLMIADNRASQLDFTPDNELLGAILADIAEQDAALVKAAGYNQAELNVLLNAGTDNPYDEWVGMPEFEQEDASAPYSIKVNFLTLDAIAEFAALVGQPITEKTVYINYPYRPDEDLKRYRATDES